GGRAGDGSRGVTRGGAPPLPIDPQEPSLQAHGCPATYAALRSEGRGANGCRSPRDSTRDASRARAAALTTSRTNRERITPNRSTGGGGSASPTRSHGKTSRVPPDWRALCGGSGSLHLGCQVQACDVRRRGGRGVVRIWLCQVGEPAPPRCPFKPSIS